MVVMRDAGALASLTGGTVTGGTDGVPCTVQLCSCLCKLSLL